MIRMLDLLLSEIEKKKEEPADDKGQSLNKQYERFLEEFKEYSKNVQEVSEDQNDFGRHYKL